MDNLILYSSKVMLSESESNPDVYIAKFIICDFSINKNGVSLNRDTIENWMFTLKNKPLVGKIKMRSDGELDFSGHNVVVVEKTDEEGNKYKDIEFDTDAFGTFVDVGIEIIDGVEYIVATAEIWKRFTRACEIIKKRVSEGTLHTSWEISVVEEIKKMVGGTISRIINDGRFIGHCLLSKYTEPAYDSSGLLEIASGNDEDMELCQALSQDIMESLNINSTEKEVQDLAKNKINEVSEKITKEEEKIEESSELKNDSETEENKEISNTDETERSADSVDNVDTSALTDRDLRQKLKEACDKALNTWGWIAFHFPLEKTVWYEDGQRKSELDYVKFTYEVVDDEITLSEPQYVKLSVSISELNETIDSRNEAIIQASEEINNLKTQITELLQYKEKFEEAEQKRIENELAEKKVKLISKYSKSGLITKEEFETSEEIKGYIDTLNEQALKDVIATRYMASLEKEDAEVSEVTGNREQKVSISASLLNEDEAADYKTIIKSYLGK